MAARPMIEISGLTKQYGEKTAVDHLNLTIYQGEIFGLLGPNGAGKTTTTLMLTGLTEPTEGTAFIDGRDCIRSPLEVKRIVGYMPDNVGFYPDLTGRENLRFTAALNGLEKQETEERINRLLARTGLTEAGDQKVGTYSRGMRQRLGVADVLMKDPSVIIMDEPSAHLDFRNELIFLENAARLIREQSASVIMATHSPNQPFFFERAGIRVKVLAVCGRTLSFEGAPSEVLTEKNIAEIYQVKSRLLCENAPETGEIRQIVPLKTI